MTDDSNSLDQPTTAALILWAMSGTVTVGVFGRAIAGAFDVGVQAWIPLLATMLTGVASLSAWTLFYSHRRRNDVGRRLLDGLLSLLPPGVVGLSTAIAATPVTLAVVMCLLVGGLGYIVMREATRQLATSPTLKATRVESVERQASTESVSTLPLESAGDQCGSPAETPTPIETDRLSIADDETSSRTGDHWQRRLLSGGGEEIEAHLIANFAAAEQSIALHLPIHPLLATTPEVECEPLDDSRISVRVTAVHRYGVRIEVKRSENADQPAQVAIGVHIVAAAASVSAA